MLIAGLAQHPPRAGSRFPFPRPPLLGVWTLDAIVIACISRSPLVRRPFLIIQLRPEDETADNELAAIRAHGGLDKDETARLRVERSGVPEIDLDRYAGIIVGGSPFDVSTPRSEKSAAQLRVEAGFQRLLDDVVERDFPFLGCCSGNGLLGNYLGVSISRKYGEPVGGVDVSLTDAGKKDPLLRGMPESFRVLVGHKEACDSVPPNSVLLATSPGCPVQMFRVRNNIYATQFHPEGDVAGFTLRINIYKHHGYFPPESAEELIEAVAREDVGWSNQILRRFAATYRDR
jgi:GMP synthase (glutamine-hydrolysing)